MEFKVGDRVKSSGNAAGVEYIVTEIGLTNRFGLPCVMLDKCEWMVRVDTLQLCDQAPPRPYGEGGTNPIGLPTLDAPAKVEVVDDEPEHGFREGDVVTLHPHVKHALVEEVDGDLLHVRCKHNGKAVRDSWGAKACSLHIRREQL